MRLRFAFFTTVVVIGLLLPGKSLYAQTISLPDATHEMAVVLQQGEELRCISLRAGVSVNGIATANRILNPSVLPDGLMVKLPTTQYIVRTTRNDNTILAEAIRSGIAEYSLRAINSAPAFHGGSLVLPLVEDQKLRTETNCTPYPLKSISPSSDTIMRGQTMMIALETVESTICEAQYLGHNEPCYALDETHYYVFIGVSALENPGVYSLHLRFTTQDLVTALVLPFSVTEGYYGFQYINPPAALNALLDGDIMRAEENYMVPWREIRTPYRSWTLPLGYPLTMQLPISADYGDRRSYGGMVDGYHSGVDFRAWTGLPVIAPADGTVVLNERLQARGNAILIDHGWGLVTGYWHLSVSSVTVGQSVVRGEIIGEVGNTGLSTGSHLHWETWVNGVSVDGKQWYNTQGFGELTTKLSQ